MTLSERKQELARESPPGNRCRSWKILIRKERWGLSWFGRLLLLTMLAAVSASFFLGAYPFLARTERVDARVLVVEGWVQEYAIRAAASEFESGRYERVVTTGGPVAGTGGYTNDYNTSASVGADRLKEAGVPPDRLQMAPSRVMSRDRTYASAVALREWFRARGEAIEKVNVLTEAPHARRTQLLFTQAFEGKVSVGVIAVQSPDYDPARWWRYSEGFKEVTGEALAFLYARFFFSPK